MLSVVNSPEHLAKNTAVKSFVLKFKEHRCPDIYGKCGPQQVVSDFPKFLDLTS